MKVDIDTTINPIMDLNSNKLLKPVRKRGKGVTQEDIDRVVSHIAKLDLEEGYPCQHRKVPVYVVGDNQGQGCTKLILVVSRILDTKRLVRHY